MKTIFVYLAVVAVVFAVFFIPQSSGVAMLEMFVPLVILICVFSAVSRKKRGNRGDNGTKYLPLFSIAVALLAFAVALGGPLIVSQGNGYLIDGYEYTGNQLGMGDLIRTLGLGSVITYNSMHDSIYSILNETSYLCQFVCRLPFYLILIGVICSALVCVNSNQKGLAKISVIAYSLAMTLFIGLWALFPLMTDQKLGDYIFGTAAVVSAVLCVLAQTCMQTYAKSK